MKKLIDSLKVPDSEEMTVRTNLTRAEIISKIEELIRQRFERLSLQQTTDPVFEGKVNSDEFQVSIIRGILGQGVTVYGFTPQIKAKVNEANPNHIKITIGFSKKDRVIAKLLTWFVRMIILAMVFVPLLGLYYEHQSLMQAGLHPESSVTWASFRDYLGKVFEGLYLKVFIFFFGIVIVMQFLFLHLPVLLMKRGMRQSREVMSDLFDA